MNLVFLQAHQALTKLFVRAADGQIAVTPYPHAAQFKSHNHEVRTLQTFVRELTHHASRGHCLLKGQLKTPLDFTSRAGSTDPNTPTEYIVIDVDGLHDHTPDQILDKLGIKDVSYIIQYSASQGVLPSKGLSCHIFVLLSTPVQPEIIKRWLILKNLEQFADYIRLTRSGVALHYPIDITACQNDKLIFIAPPNCTPKELDQLKEERIKLVEKDLPTYDFPRDVPEVQGRVHEWVNALRKIMGLNARLSYQQKVLKGVEYMPNPNQATITGVKEARGFTYLNLNGGDSWAYWHPNDNIEFIHNFKGEPTYRTEELLPKYHYDFLQAQVPEAEKAKEWYGFRDPRADTYYTGWHHPGTGQYEFFATSNKIKVQDFLSLHGLGKPKEIEDWKCEFDPASARGVEPKQKYWNRFIPSEFMVLPKSDGHLPSTILSIIKHVIGTDQLLLDGFLNWLAFAFQHRRATGTAWILQGVPGTGKGILANHIIKPLFGATNYTARRMEELEDRFNGYLENCLICYIDEVNIGVSKRSDMIMANLKNQITEERITVRNMRQTAYEVPNYLNWVMSSNMNTPIILDREDRRFNVGAYQTKPIREIFPDTAALIQAIEVELPSFAAFLQGARVDMGAVRVPVRNEARDELIDNSRTSLDIVGDAILKGDIDTLYHLHEEETNTYRAIKADAYLAVLKDIVKQGRKRITRGEMMRIFDYAVGETPDSPAKFTRFLKHRNIKLKKMRIEGSKPVMGIEVDWVVTDEVKAELLGGTPPVLRIITETPDGGLSGVQ